MSSGDGGAPLPFVTEVTPSDDVRASVVDERDRHLLGDGVVRLGDVAVTSAADRTPDEPGLVLPRVGGGRCGPHALPLRGDQRKRRAAAQGRRLVAGNEVVIAQNAGEVDLSQITAAQQTAEAARQALRSITQTEGYLRVTAPFDGVVTERNVHPGTLIGPMSESSW